jgi:hypothetical protein
MTVSTFLFPKEKWRKEKGRTAHVSINFTARSLKFMFRHLMMGSIINFFTLVSLRIYSDSFRKCGLFLFASYYLVLLIDFMQRAQTFSFRPLTFFV